MSRPPAHRSARGPGLLGLLPPAIALVVLLWPAAGEAPPAAPRWIEEQRWQWNDDRPWRSAPTAWAQGDLGCLAFLEHRIGEGDRLGMVRLEEDGGSRHQIVQPRAGELLHPSGATDADGRAVLVWTELHEGCSQLWWAREADESWSPPAALATPGRRADHPCLTRHGDRLWLAWQAWIEPGGEARGRSEIRLAPLEPEGLGEVRAITDREHPDAAPQLASVGEDLWIAWTHSNGRDREIHGRCLGTDGRLSETRSLSLSPLSDDLHPSIAGDAQGRLWVAFDSVRDEIRGRSLVRTEEGDRPRGQCVIRVHCWDGERMLAPGGDDGATVVSADDLSISGGFPRLVATGDSMVLIHRGLADRDADTARHSYPVLVRDLGPEGWGAPRRLEQSEGAQEPASALALGDGVLVAQQQDYRHLQTRNRLTVLPTEEDEAAMEAAGQWLSGVLGPSGISAQLLRRAPAASLPPGSLAAITPGEGEHPHALGDPEDPILSGRQHLEIQDGERRYKVYWGDLHRHSSVSRCLNGISPAPDDRYAFGRDICQYDFFALTDHSGHLDPYQWWQLNKRVELYQTPRFVTFGGYEWSTFKYGHQNVIYRGRDPKVVSPGHARGRDPESLWASLVEGDAITIPHHPAHGRAAVDWSHYDPRFLRLVEIYQAARGNFEFDGCWRQAEVASASGHFVQDALEQGCRVGIIASTDHGSGASYAAVLAERLDRDSIFDALLARRTYGATTKGILLDLRVNDALMGSEIQTREPPRLRLQAQGTQDLADVRVFRNGRPFFGRGNRKMVRGDDLLSLRWWSRDTDEEWNFELVSTTGRFEFASEEDAEDRRHHRWSLEDEGRRLVGWYSGQARSKSPVRKFRHLGDDRDEIRVTVQGSRYVVRLPQLRRRPLRVSHQSTRWVLQTDDSRREDLVGEGLGRRDFEREWIDDEFPAEGAWYYARVIQVDGEMAWTSPIWVDPTED